MSTLLQKYGPYALVTGASSGIGRAFAFELAAQGFNLFIVARGKEALVKTAEEIKQQHGVTVITSSIDLSDSDSSDSLIQTVKDTNVGLVVNNAGWGKPGVFNKHSEKDSLKELNLNITTPMRFSNYFISNVLGKRKKSGIIFLSSIAGYTGSPFLAGYAASKAWVLNFGMALGVELKPKGIDVLVTAPGPTRTGMFGISNLDFEKLPMHWMQPQDVAKQALSALGRKSVIIPGRINKAMNFISSRIMSKSFAMSMFGKMMKKSMPESIL